MRYPFGRIGTALVLACSVALTACSSTGSSSSKSDPSKGKRIETSAKAKPKITSKTKVPTSARVASSLQRRPSEINKELKNVRITRTGEVYLLRGLANVFSRGMDTMGEKLVRKGVDARVFNHGAWKELADNIIVRSKRKQVSYPIAILGHSLGANAAIRMGHYLGSKGIPVAYVVAYDPTVPSVIGKNVAHLVNYYIPKEDKQKPTRRVAGFKGKLQNINISNRPGITHMNVEKNRGFQRKAIAKIMSITKRKSSAKKRTSSRRSKARFKRRG